MYKEMFDLTGRVAIVTGGSRGIGEAIAMALSEFGVKIVLCSRKIEGLTAVKEKIEAAGGEAVCIPAHMGKIESVRSIIDGALEAYGTIDILVNNAATNPYYGPIIDIDTPRADKTVRVNQSGYLEWTQAAWRAGMSGHGGVVLNVASIGGLSVEGGIGWYNVTKAAVIHLTSQLAGELGPKVRVNAVAPGLVKTEFARALWEAGEESISRRMPLRRLGEVEDIASAALFLCSDAASWLSLIHI